MVEYKNKWAESQGELQQQLKAAKKVKVANDYELHVHVCYK